MPPRLGDAPLTNAEKQQRKNERQKAERAALSARVEQLQTAINEAYRIMCSGKPPHSARETNARRVLRLAGANVDHGRQA
jgi:cell division protein FtsB